MILNVDGLCEGLNVIFSHFHLKFYKFFWTKVSVKSLTYIMNYNYSIIVLYYEL